MEEDEIVLQAEVHYNIGEPGGEVGCPDDTFAHGSREFHCTAFNRQVEQGAEIGEPMAEVMQLIRKSDHS